jgi:hypothetical protein
MTTIRMQGQGRVCVGALYGVLLSLLCGCGSEAPCVGSVVTLREINALRDVEILLPVDADSIAALYAKYDRETFAVRRCEMPFCWWIR